MMQTFFHYVIAFTVPALFLLAATVAWALVVFQIPGNWIVLLLSLLYGWYEGFRAVAWWVLLAGFLIAAVGEVVEWGTGYLGATRFGGRRLSGFAAIVGSILGGLVGAAFGWGLGAIPGSVIGAFAGALLVEIIRQKKAGKALKVGFGAGLGRAIGLSAKMGLGAAFLALLYIRIIWVALAGGSGIPAH
jgi:uncharacterized protein YqgC (DUF456 family)